MLFGKKNVIRSNDSTTIGRNLYRHNLRTIFFKQRAKYKYLMRTTRSFKLICRLIISGRDLTMYRNSWFDDVSHSDLMLKTKSSYFKTDYWRRSVYYINWYYGKDGEDLVKTLIHLPPSTKKNPKNHLSEYTTNTVHV